MTAGLIRRVSALCLDLLVAATPAAIAFIIFGAMVPLDDHSSELFLLLAPAAVLGLTYAFLGTGIFKNTFGGFVSGTRVRQPNGARPSVGQAFLRSVALTFWPIEALVVAFGSDKGRLTDRMSGTVVEIYKPSRPPVARIAAAVLLVVPMCSAVTAAAPLVNRRLTVSTVAQGYLAENESVIVGVPRTVRVVNDAAIVGYRVSRERAIEVDLERAHGAWSVMRTRDVDPSQIGWWSFSLSKTN